MAADEKWYFTKEQLANTPSRKCGYDVDKELSYRQQAANFIQDMGQRLLVTQLCINTAIVYMHRFYVFHSFTQFHRNAMAAASLFLAAKVEEQPRKLEHVIKVAHVCLHRDQPTLDTKSEAYLEQAQDLVFNENVLLQTLGFDVAIDHPHTHVVRCCHLVKASKDLAQTSYFMASNSLHLTTMCLQYKPTVVACFCIHLACKWSNWEIPQSNEGKDWFWYVDKTVSLDQLEQLTAEFLVIFDKCPTKLKHKIKSISATQNTVMPQNIISSPFDTEPRKIRPESGSGLTLEGQGPSFRPHHSHPESKPGLLATPEDPFKKQQMNAQPSSRDHQQPQRGDCREYREKKERERQEREKMAQASGNRDGHHHHHHHHHHSQQPSSISHHNKTATSKPVLQPPQSHHHKQMSHASGADSSQRPNSAVTASRDAARREQAYAREVNRKRGDLTSGRGDYMFAPPTRHDVKDQPPPSVIDGQGGGSNQLVDPSIVTNHLGNVSNCGINSVRKDGQGMEWTNESEADGATKHIPPSDKYRDKEGAASRSSEMRHSQPIETSKRSGPNFDASRHSKVPPSDNRLNANSAVTSDVRVMKENAMNTSQISDSSQQKHLYNHIRHNRRVEQEGQDTIKRPPMPNYDVSSKRVATPPPPPVVKSSKSTEHKPEHVSSSGIAKREEDIAASNGKVPSAVMPRIQVNASTLSSSHHHSQDKHGHSRSSRDKSPSLHHSRSPVPPVVASTNIRPKSPTIPTSGSKSSSKSVPSQAQYYTPGQPKPEAMPPRNGTSHHGAPPPEEKRRSHVADRPLTPPKMEAVTISSPPVTTRTSQKVTSTPEKGGHSLRERESPYPQRKARQRTPPSSGKKQQQPLPPALPVPEKPAPLSPGSGILSPFGSPPPPTPTTPGKVLPSGTLSSRVSTRNRTSSSSSEPELIPVIMKLDQIEGYKNIIRDSKMSSIKLPGRVPDIIQPIRDRKVDDGSRLSGGKGGGDSGVSVAKELKPPELIRPFSTVQSGDMGAVAFPSPMACVVTAESDSIRTSLPAESIDVISVTDPVQSPEKMSVPMPEVSKSFPTTAVSNIIPSLIIEPAVQSKKSSEHHHKSEKKKKKDKHKHKEKDKDREKNRDDGKHRKSKHKSKDKDRHKDRAEVTTVPPTSAPIKITIPKDKLNLSSTLEPSSALASATGVTSTPSTSGPGLGLKLKIQKDRLKGTDSTGSSPQSMKVEPPPQSGGLKIKIVNTNAQMSSSGKESRKRERGSPKMDQASSSSSSAPPLKSARLSESSRRGAGTSYNKQNGVESRSSNSGGRGQHYTVGTKMVQKLADTHNSQSKGKPPTTGNQQ